jgi:hypothetical protein
MHHIRKPCHCDVAIELGHISCRCRATRLLFQSLRQKAELMPGDKRGGNSSTFKMVGAQGIEPWTSPV